MYLNSYSPPPVSYPIPDTKELLFEHTPADSYDLNTCISLPPSGGVLQDYMVRLEPLIVRLEKYFDYSGFDSYDQPLLHADALHDALSCPSDDPDEVWFYPYPFGKPFTSKLQTLQYIEKQRRRNNVLTFAIIAKSNGSVEKMAGMIALCVTPGASTQDARLLGVKLFPNYRGTSVFKHTIGLIFSWIFGKEEGSLALPRLAWRTPPENARSQKAAEKVGFKREGIMRCYEVSTKSSLNTTTPAESPYKHFSLVKDGSETTEWRVTQDAVVYSVTAHDWFGGLNVSL